MDRLFSAPPSKFIFRFFVCVLSVSILLSGCHSYFVIPKDNYNKIETLEDIKIVYTNGKEFVVEKNDTTYAKLIGDSLIVNRGSEKKVIQMNEVEKIKENRFDLGGTITISLVTLTILVVLYFSMDPFKT